MPGISRQELKKSWNAIVQPIPPASVYERARELVFAELEAVVQDLVPVLKDLPNGVCLQFGIAEAPGEVWTFWLNRDLRRKPSLLWGSGAIAHVFEDVIDPAKYESLSMHDAQIATRVIRAWLESSDRKTVTYPVATLREAGERLALESP
jgi:hypothetical protein